MSKMEVIDDYIERTTPAAAREMAGLAVERAVQRHVDDLAESVVTAYFESNREYILDKMAAHVEAWLDSKLADVLDRWLEEEARSVKGGLENG